MFINKKTLSILTTLLFTSLLAPVVAHQHQQIADAIQISDPWVRSAPSNAPALGAFMQIHNHLEHDVKLIAAQTPGYQRVELHRTKKQDGMMKMIKQDFMPIAANGALTLKPGSWHVMLIGPEAVPELGQQVPITLYFDNDTKQVVNAVVRKGMMMHKPQQMHTH